MSENNFKMQNVLTDWGRTENYVIFFVGFKERKIICIYKMFLKHFFPLVFFFVKHSQTFVFLLEKLRRVTLKIIFALPLGILIIFVRIHNNWTKVCERRLITLRKIIENSKVFFSSEIR